MRKKKIGKTWIYLPRTEDLCFLWTDSSLLKDCEEDRSIRIIAYGQEVGHNRIVGEKRLVLDFFFTISSYGSEPKKESDSRLV